MSWLLATPLVLPFLTAVAAFLLRSQTAGRWISVAGNTALLVAAIALIGRVLQDGVIAGQMGGWVAPFGITLVADFLSAVMVVITAITALAVAVYALTDIDRRSEHLGYHALFNVLIGGVTGAFLTGDLFNLYVWFEVMLISSFGLLILGGRKAQIDGGVKYVTLNLISTILFLSGVGLLYGMTGTLNMADLARTVPQVENQGLVTVVAMMFMIAFGVKAAVFPLFFWLPASYHTPAFSVSAVFAGLLTKVGVYALIRMFTLVFNGDTGFTHDILLWVAGLTMLTGVLGAAAQNDIRKILSFHIVSQIGYMIMGLALLTPLALAGAVFYLVHHIIVKANLFLIAGVAERLTGSTDLGRIGGLYKSAPLLAVLFLIPAFSLAGFPPLSGFWAKYVLVSAALEVQGWVIAAVALVVGLLTIYSMTKIWAEAFWKAHPDGVKPALSQLDREARAHLLIPVASLAALTMVIGFFPQPFIAFAEAAAAQLLDPTAYLAAVLGGELMNNFAANLVLAAVWAVFFGDFNWLTLLSGFVAGYVVLWLLQPLMGTNSSYFLRVWYFLKLIVLFHYELLVSSLEVLWDVITPTHRSRPAIIEMPLDVTSDAGILLVTNLITLTPGTLSIDVSEDRKTLKLHAMFADDPEAVCHALKSGMEKWVIDAVEERA